MNIPGLHDTITRLAALRSRIPHPLTDTPDPRLKKFAGFGSNPGDLLAHSYAPPNLRAGAPLVVVLHGCTQSASSYNRGAGWTSAADEHGFALLFPEQQRSNNPNLCFNWFSAADAARWRGEALSVAQMVQDLCSRHDLARGRVYITGLSAGGAMAAAMLATYPEVFAGGAVIAGLPFGTATTVPEAFERMRGQVGFAPEQLTSLVRSATHHSGQWPTLSVWHGSSDRTVYPSNAAALVDQWRGLHGVAVSPTATQTVAGQLRRVWCNEDGAEVIEEYLIEGMGHGTPIDSSPANEGEAAGPHMLNVGISSTRRIIRFWGLHQEERPAHSAAPHRMPRLEKITPPQVGQSEASAPRHLSRTTKVQDVIEKALRGAGLMR
jgi:poly(hydroxyalkanoate) depolymerase family esterase